MIEPPVATPSKDPDLFENWKPQTRAGKVFKGAVQAVTFTLGIGLIGGFLLTIWLLPGYLNRLVFHASAEAAAEQQLQAPDGFGWVCLGVVVVLVLLGVVAAIRRPGMALGEILGSILCDAFRP